MSEINVIVCIDQKFGIGLNNRLPWNLPEELAIFKEKTMDSVVIVGSKTYQTLPALKGRVIYTVSSAFHPLNNTANIFPNFEDAYYQAETTGKKIFVIGGLTLYKYVLTVYRNRIKLHLSQIKNTFVCDTYLDRYLLDNFYIENEIDYITFVHKELRYKPNGEQQYLDLVQKVSIEGETRLTRSGDTKTIFGHNLKFDLRQGFPLLTTKKMFTKGIIEELLFFLRGETDTKILEAKGINIWKGNTSREFLDNLGFKDRPEGLMGPLYPTQWRHFNGFYDETTGLAAGGVDQIEEIIKLIKVDPTSRRILFTSFNPSQAKQGVLYCCHSVSVQFYVSNDGSLDMFCYNRSSDIGLGLPFNIASSALLLSIIARLTDKKTRFLHISLGDAHIYKQHETILLESLNRLPHTWPSLELPEKLTSLEAISSLTSDDFKILNYRSYPTLKMPMNV